MAYRSIPFFTLLLAVIGLVIAQGGDRGTVTQASIGLLSDAAIRKELKLTKEQETTVKTEFGKLNDAAKQIFSKRPKDQAEATAAQARLRSMQMSLVTRLQARLTSPQAKRLREIALQKAGPFAMLSPEIQAEMAINSGQVGKIKATQKWLVEQAGALQKKRNAEIQSIPRPTDQKDRAAVNAYVEKVNALIKRVGPGDKKTLDGFKRSAEEKVMAALSATQRTKWKAMLGAPFKAK